MFGMFKNLLEAQEVGGLEDNANHIITELTRIMEAEKTESEKDTLIRGGKLENDEVKKFCVEAKKIIGRFSNKTPKIEELEAKIVLIEKEYMTE